MEDHRHQNLSSEREFGTEETCESVYQSVGYDSGICLSNYRSTDGALLSRDGGAAGDGVLDRLRTLHIRDGDKSRLESDDCCESSTCSSAAVQSCPIATVVCETKEAQQVPCIEDQIYKQDEEGDTLLHLAIIKPDVSVAIRMIEMTRIPECLDIQNKTYMHTPLHLAVLMNQPPVVRALLILGASLTSRDRNGNTALHLACKLGDIECVRQLTAPFSEMENRYMWTISEARGTQICILRPMQSADINLMNYEGESSLQLALFSGTKAGFEIFDCLVIHCSANINTKDGKCGYTVLHQAVKSKDIVMVQFLLRYPKLSINDLCYSGNTALDIAISLNLPRLELVIKMAGGICTESTDYPEVSDDNQVDEFDDLMIGGLRLNS